MKVRVILIVSIILCLNSNLCALGNGIHSLKIQDILDFYNGPIENLRKLEQAENAAALSDNRIRINYLNRHIEAFDLKLETDISDHLKSIYKDAVIKLYEELDSLQGSIITDNIDSINALSIYLSQFKSKKQGQDETFNNIGARVENLRSILSDLSETFDSYDRIIDKQNELITEALDLDIEAYSQTIFLAPGLEAASNIEPYLSLGIGYISNTGRFSCGGILKVGYSPRKEIVTAGASVVLGFNFDRIE